MIVSLLESNIGPPSNAHAVEDLGHACVYWLFRFQVLIISKHVYRKHRIELYARAVYLTARVELYNYRS